MSATPDRNLLFGLLALKMGLVSRDALLDALQAWLGRKADPLGLVLQQLGALSEAEREAVERLVEEHAAGREPRTAADDWPQTAVSAPPLPTTAPAPARPPRRYEKLRPHARGGLGEVFVALDVELRREVALKEIQGRYADRPELRERFVREAEITGHLEHPGVVPIYGLGAAAEDGRPYYAMRFIRGESLHDAIRRFHRDGHGPRPHPARELALRELLRRFVDVCNAVAYAHSRGVIHRDLKPANVMLGGYGETLVVDWGLAKVVGTSEGAPAEGLPRGSGATMVGQAVGTPAYMPPEQARGELDKVGPQSDVFALGATLYHLLTGGPPYEKDGVSLLGAAAACDHPPARRANARVPAALSAVCARAMAPAPEGRYAGPRELAADVERWLADEPVTAMPEPWREKARRWARRNRTLVASAVVLLAASVVGLSVGLVAVRAEKARTEEALGREEAQRKTAEGNLARAVTAEEVATARQRLAEKNYRLARKAVDETFGVARDHPLLARPGRDPNLLQLRQVLIEKSLPFYRDFEAQRPDDPEAMRDSWQQHYWLGWIMSEQGNPVEALASYRRAEQAARRQLAVRPGQAEAHNDLAGTFLQLGIIQQSLGRRDEAMASYNESVTSGRAANKARPGQPAYLVELARALSDRAALSRQRGDNAAARRDYEEAIILHRDLVKAGPNTPAHAVELAAALDRFGALLTGLGLREEAGRSHGEAVRLLRQVVEKQPGVIDYMNDLARALVNLGYWQVGAGRIDDALRSTAEAVGLGRTVAASLPHVPSYQHDLIRTLINQAIFQQSFNKHPEAAANYGEAIEVARALVRRHPKVPEYRVSLGRAILARAVFHRDRRKDPKAARPDYDEAVVVLADAMGRDKDGPNAWGLLILAHDQRARLREAEGDHRGAADDWGRVMELSPPSARAAPRLARALALARAGDHDRAAAEAAELAAAPRGGGELYDLACVLSLCAGGAGRDDRLPLPRRERLAEARARAAVALLGRAAEAGLFRAAGTVAHMHKDTDLDHLRSRADFRAWVATLPAAEIKRP